MLNLFINTDGNYVIDGEEFSEDELAERFGQTMTEFIKTTTKTLEKQIEDKAAQLYKYHKKKFRERQIEQYLKENPSVEIGFQRFNRTEEDYIDEARRTIGRGRSL